MGLPRRHNSSETGVFARRRDGLHVFRPDSRSVNGCTHVWRRDTQRSMFGEFSAHLTAGIQVEWVRLVRFVCERHPPEGCVCERHMGWCVVVI